MDAIGIIGLIALVIVLILVFSLLGWVGKLLEVILDFIGEGCSSSLGCLLWIFAIIIGILAVMG